MSEVLWVDEEAVVIFIDYTTAFDSLSHCFLDEVLAEAGFSPKVRWVFQATHVSVSGAVCIWHTSGVNVVSELFSSDRSAVQGDIFRPPWFTIGLDAIFRRHDMHYEGVGGPLLNTLPIPKLEYADVAITNKTIEEAPMRLCFVSRGSRCIPRYVDKKGKVQANHKILCDWNHGSGSDCPESQVQVSSMWQIIPNRERAKNHDSAVRQRRGSRRSCSPTC